MMSDPYEGHTIENCDKQISRLGQELANVMVRIYDAKHNLSKAYQDKEHIEENIQSIQLLRRHLK